MAILDKQSFSSGATAAELGWSTGNTSTTSGRFGGGHFRLGYTAEGSRVLPMSAAAFGCHFALKAEAYNSSTRIHFREDATTHVNFLFDGNYKITANRNGTLLGTGTTTFLPNIWYGIEVWIVVHDTQGVVKVWVNGAATPEIDLSGIDTKNGGTGLVTTLNIGCSSANTYICDLVVYDGTGGVNDTAPLGDLKVEYVSPSGNGASSMLVGSDSNSTDNYALVDEVPPNGDTDYVESSTPNDKDTYEMGALVSTTGTVLAVGALIYAKKTDAGGRTIAPVYRLAGGTEADGATVTLASDYSAHTEIQQTKPGGGAYSISDVNGMQVGVKVIA